MNNNMLKKVLALCAEAPFDVEITGPEQAKQAIIFVHGFGVTRDARGLFTDIEKQLSQSMLCFRGEFSEVTSERCIAIPFPSQQKRLQTIRDHINKYYSISHITYIGHSQGCIVIAQDQPQKSDILLLAPPVTSPYDAFIKTSGWKRPSSYLDVSGKSRLVRSDLTIDINPDFWEEFKNVDAEKLYISLAQENKVNIIFAGNDQVLGVQKAPTGIPASCIENACHDFKNSSRAALIKLIGDLTDVSHSMGR